MSVELVTVKRVYLKSKDLWRSAHHTAWAPNPHVPRNDKGDSVLMSLEFFWGVARDVPQNVYDAFAAIGIATTERPKRRDEDDD